jgi:hypothetical protein
MVGAWAGDGTGPIDTRQRRRQADRAEAKKAERERVAGVRASQREIERQRHEAAMGSMQEQIGAAVRGAKGGA